MEGGVPQHSNIFEVDAVRRAEYATEAYIDEREKHPHICGLVAELAPEMTVRILDMLQPGQLTLACHTKMRPIVERFAFVFADKKPGEFNGISKKLFTFIIEELNFSSDAEKLGVFLNDITDVALLLGRSSEYAKLQSPDERLLYTIATVTGTNLEFATEDDIAP